jgi:hypothetical protein
MQSMFALSDMLEKTLKEKGSSSLGLSIILILERSIEMARGNSKCLALKFRFVNVSGITV